MGAECKGTAYNPEVFLLLEKNVNANIVISENVSFGG